MSTGHSNSIWMGWGSKNWSALIKYFYQRKDAAEVQQPDSLVAQIIKEKVVCTREFPRIRLVERVFLCQEKYLVGRGPLEGKASVACGR
jgi:hypothetical protein